MASKYVQVYTDLKKKIENRELEIGQASALLRGKGIQTVAEVMQELTDEYNASAQ